MQRNENRKQKVKLSNIQLASLFSRKVKINFEF